jgi:hypothetical protein
MTTKLDKDPTKSIVWLALDKATKEKLIGMELEVTSLPNPGFDDFICHSKRQASEIHKVLGTTGGDLTTLNDHLEFLVRNYDEGICNEIKNYLQKFDDIRSAIKSEAKVKGVKKEQEKGVAI